MSTKNARFRSRWGRWGFRLIWVGLALGLMLAGVGLLATCRPDWYRPHAVDYTRLSQDKRNLVGLLDQIGAALNAGEAIEVSLDAAQINRWLAARDELWPDQSTQWRIWENPLVHCGSGQVTFAAQVETAGGPLIVSCTLRGRAEPDTVRLEADAPRVGRLPVPWRWLQARLNPENNPLAGHLRRHNGQFVLDNHFVWPNGKRSFRIEDLAIAPGRIRLKLSPLKVAP